MKRWEVILLSDGKASVRLNGQEVYITREMYTRRELQDLEHMLNSCNLTKEIVQ